MADVVVHEVRRGPGPATRRRNLRIYVDPGAWRRGCGRALLAHALTKLSAQGLAEVTLWLRRSNERARRFYEAQGLVADGASKVEHNRDGVAFDEVRYRCEVVDPL